MSDEEKKAYDCLIILKYFTQKKEDKKAINTILNLIEKQQKEIEELKQTIVKATEIIEEYADETENDTKKIIEYQEKIKELEEN